MLDHVGLCWLLGSHRGILGSSLVILERLDGQHGAQVGLKVAPTRLEWVKWKQEEAQDGPNMTPEWSLMRRVGPQEEL